MNTRLSPRVASRNSCDDLSFEGAYATHRLLGRRAAHNATTLCVYSGRMSLRRALNGVDDTCAQITANILFLSTLPDPFRPAFFC